MACGWVKSIFGWTIHLRHLVPFYFLYIVKKKRRRRKSCLFGVRLTRNELKNQLAEFEKSFCVSITKTWDVVSTPIMDPSSCGTDSTVGRKDSKAHSSTRHQREGMGNLWKNAPAPEHEDSPRGESHGTVEERLQRKRSKRRGETQQLEWWDVFVKWRVALVESCPIRGTRYWLV